MKDYSPSSMFQLPVVMENRLEALTVLFHSILNEIEALKKGGNNDLRGKISLHEEVERFEKELIQLALIRTKGRQRKAAGLLNVKVTTLNAKIKRYGISSNGLPTRKELSMPD